MTNDLPAVVIIGPNRLVAAKPRLHQVQTSSQLELNWDSRTLVGALTQVKDQFKVSEVKVIVAGGLCFLSAVNLSAQGSEELEERVLRAAEEILPERTDKLGIDWKVVYKRGSDLAIQIFAMRKAFLSLLGQTMAEAGLSIVSIEPLAYALARTQPTSKEPVLILWADQEVTAAVVHSGQVIASRVIADLDIYNQIASLISSSEEKYQLRIKNIIMPKKQTRIDKNKLSASRLGMKTVSVKERDFDIFKTAAMKPDIDGNDEEVLNITPKEVFADEDNYPETDKGRPQLVTINTEEDLGKEQDILMNEPVASGLADDPEAGLAAPLPPQKETEEEKMTNSPNDFFRSETKKKSHLKTTVLVFLMLLVITGVVLGGVIVYNQAMKQVQPASPLPTPTATATPAATPTPTPAAEVNRKEVKLEVQNGSGIRGLAGKVVTYLESLGYEEVESGNADNFDYGASVLRVKTGKEALAEFIKADLKDKYPIGEIGKALGKDSQFDAIVILGKQAEASPSATPKGE